jgi:predicted DNA binding CopG/RHH family protein
MHNHMKAKKMLNELEVPKRESGQKLAPLDRTVSVRVSADLWSKVERYAAQDGLHPTVFARRCLHKIVRDLEKQAEAEAAKLGITHRSPA